MTFQHHPTVQELFDQGAPVTPFLRGPLNQWHRAHFSIDGTEFNCAEQYMMYRKAQMFGDARMAAMILEATKPFDHKRMGQQVQGFDQDAWVEARVEIVLTGNRAKFGQNDGLAKKPLRTDGTILAEVNPRDKIWGIGLAEADSGVQDPAQWRGLNLLGSILMEVRRELADAEAV
ncbi:MAG: NADAR family protein [Hyphomicrobiales bacterium]